MALNWQTFKTRTGTAVIFVLVMLTGLLWNQWSFFLLVTLIHFGCWVEYQQLLIKIDPEYAHNTPLHRYGVMLAGWCLILFACSKELHLGILSLNSIGWYGGLVFLFVLPLVELLFARNLLWKQVRYSILGLLYISISLACLVNLRGIDGTWISDKGHLQFLGFLLPLAIIFSIWINDTMAYIVGSLIGRTPFSAISPKKTWEGTIGGMILCVVVMGLLAKWLGFSIGHTVVIASISAIAGTAGDLLESKLKRMAGVKDSGHIMPGHGGFLDRFDSLLVATPFVWLYVVLFLL
jgi:phosphatidate cytidylyltransferase